MIKSKYFADGFVCDLKPEYSSDYLNEDIRKNCELRDKIDSIDQNQGNFHDIEQLYIRSWVQLLNLFIGCVILGIIVNS